MENLRAAGIALFVAAIISAAIGFLVRTTGQNTDDVRYGAQVGSMVNVSRGYAQANRSTIITAVNAAGGNAVQYTSANLIAAGLLDPSSNGTTPTGGSWCLEFRTYNAGANLQGVLTVVNETAPKTAIDAAVVSQQAGTSFTGTVVSGVVTYPGGSQALSAFTGPNACAAANNAVAAVITDNDSIGTTNYLCRTPIPGNASCATMAQDLNMGGNNITNANTISGTNLVVSGFDPSGFGQVRMNTGNYGTFFRNDGTTFYLLSTAAGDQNGQWNGLRPFFYNLGSGAVNIDGTGAGTSFGGTTTAPTVVATGSVQAPAYYHSSDRSLKADIKPVRNPWTLLEPIIGERYHWKESGRPDYGVIAQDVEQTMPELVTIGENGKRLVNYDGLFGIVIPALKDLRAEEQRDRQQIRRLTAENARLKVEAVRGPAPASP